LAAAASFFISGQWTTVKHSTTLEAAEAAEAAAAEAAKVKDRDRF